MDHTEMISFELFCLAFYALDAVWEAEPDPTFGTWFSDANPVLFADCGSAVSCCFADFGGRIEKREITILNGSRDILRFLYSEAIAKRAAFSGSALRFA